MVPGGFSYIMGGFHVNGGPVSIYLFKVKDTIKAYIY